MCGIIGYIGNKMATPILIDGLKHLEYRGYDSAGLAIIHDGHLALYRVRGKISDLERIVVPLHLQGTVGLGHSRWATHGQPSEENAHPHTDCKGRLVVVHNGIIENYLSLKQQLKKEGHRFRSETDTEVIAHLVEKYFEGDLTDAVTRAVKHLRGSYAIAVISADSPDTIVGARQYCPLVIGLGNGQYFLASDIPAFLRYTREALFVEDGEVVTITRNGVKIKDSNGAEVKRSVTRITWDSEAAEKGGFKHFMLKEINEQPRVITDTFRGRISSINGEVSLSEVGLTTHSIEQIDRIYIIACGTSYHAALIGKFLIEDWAGIPCEVDIGSEFRYRTPVIGSNSIAVFISQSGETADTLAALRAARSRHAHTIAICNVVGSSLARDSDSVVYTHAGPEIGVASTKTFTAQLTALVLLAVLLGRRKKTLLRKDASKVLKELLRVPTIIEEVLSNDKEIIMCARRFYQKDHFLYLGRNINYPIALEGALKLKEISYIHAEGYPAGEMKHGPIALIDKDMPVLAIATQGKVQEKVISNIEEVKARKGIVIALASKDDKNVAHLTDMLIPVPSVEEFLSPIVNVVPLQLLAYHIARLRGCEIDQPRNLAKSVTVE